MAAGRPDFQAFLKETSHYDKDNRFMAFSDLSRELSKDVQIDAALERQIVSAVLGRLEAANEIAEVQSIAVRCLQGLVSRAQNDTLREICQKLSEQVLATGEESDRLRDVYAIGLKNTVTGVKDEMGRIVADAIIQPMMTGVQSSQELICYESIDVVTTLLRRFGSEVQAHFARLLDIFMDTLRTGSQKMRKRASSALAALAGFIPDSLLQSMVDRILEGITSRAGAAGGGGGGDGFSARSLVQTIGGISREVGWRLGKHLDGIVPHLIEAIGDADDDDRLDEANAELRETSLHALESFLLRCPAEMTPWILGEGKVLDVVLRFMVFDPNYTYEDGADVMGGGGGGDAGGGDAYGDDYGDEYGEYGDEYGYDDGVDDDDDPSWKVRRAAVQTLSAIISSRPEMLGELYPEVAEPLVTCFREREDGVKLEVFQAFTALLRSTVVVEGHAAFTLPPAIIEKLGVASSLPANVNLNTKVLAPETGVAAADAAGLLQAPPLMRQKSVTCDLLPDLLPSAVSKAVAQAKSAKSDKTKAAVFQMLNELALAVGAQLEDYLEELVTTTVDVVANDKDGQVRLEALAFLRMLLDTAPARAFHGLLPRVIPVVVAAVADDWFKLVAEALRVCGRLAVALRPRDQASGDFMDAAADTEKHADALCEVVLSRLERADLDLEVKDAAILTVGLILSHVGNTSAVAGRTDVILGLLLERLRNEITRMSVLKCLSFVALSPLAPDLAGILQPALEELTSLLRQKSRQLRQATLAALEALITRNGSSVTREAADPMLRDAANMVNDEDLFLAHMSLRVAISLSAANESLAGLVAERFLPAANGLAASAVLQNPALSSLRTFYRTVADHKSSGFDAAQLISELAAAGGGAASAAAGGGAAASDASHSKASIRNIARCIAVLVATQSVAEQQADASRFAGMLGAGSTAEQLLGLYCLGEVGALLDLPTVQTGISDQVAALFASEHEEVKVAAAAALGGIAAGAGDAGMSGLAARLSGADAQVKYLLLSAVRESIARHAPFVANGPAFTQTAICMPLVAGNADADDEGVRTLVAECAGRLMVIDPANCVQPVVGLLTADSWQARWTAVAALRFALREPALEALSPIVDQFMGLLMDDNLLVRHAALQSLRQIVHDAPLLVRRLMLPPAADTAAAGAGDGEIPRPTGDVNAVGVMAVLNYEMVPRADLRRVVQLGPFKETIDDGLPLRKAAFACMESFIDRMPDRLSISFLARLCDGASDQDDVAMQSHQLVVKLCGMADWQPRIVAELERLAPAIGNAFKAYLKAKKKPPVSDVMRSAMRAIDAIAQQCADAMTITPFADLVDTCTREPAMAEALAAIQADSAGAA